MDIGNGRVLQLMKSGTVTGPQVIRMILLEEKNAWQYGTIGMEDGMTIPVGLITFLSVKRGPVLDRLFQL